MGQELIRGLLGDTYSKLAGMMRHIKECLQCNGSHQAVSETGHIFTDCPYSPRNTLRRRIRRWHGQEALAKRDDPSGCVERHRFMHQPDHPERHAGSE
jgi:hypothetical protein